MKTVDSKLHLKYRKYKNKYHKLKAGDDTTKKEAEKATIARIKMEVDEVFKKIIELEKSSADSAKKIISQSTDVNMINEAEDAIKEIGEQKKNMVKNLDSVTKINVAKALRKKINNTLYVVEQQNKIIVDLYDELMKTLIIDDNLILSDACNFYCYVNLRGQDHHF